MCIRITEQCGRESYGDLLCDDQTSTVFVMLILFIVYNILSVGNLLGIISKFLLYNSTMDTLLSIRSYNITLCISL